MPRPSAAQIGVASTHQPLPFAIRSVAVTLRVTAMVPAVPVARLVRGSEIYVAPRLRVRPADGAAAGGSLLAGAAAAGSGTQAAPGASAAQQQEDGEEEEDAAAAPLQAVLRVQQIDSRAAASLQAAVPAAASALPPGVQLVGACPDTLARCGLRPQDWVRLSGRGTRSLIKFACLAATPLAAPGHLALTPQQCEWAGAPPFSHIRLQRLTRGQRQMIEEAAELQAASGSRTSGSSRATLGEMLKPQAPTAAAAADGAEEQQQDGGQLEEEGPAGAVALAASGWLRPAAEAALQRLLPVLGLAPRSLLQVRGRLGPGA